MTNIPAASTLEALKQYLRIAPEDIERDALLTMLLESCTEAAEKFLGRYILARAINGEPHDFDGAPGKYIQLENYPVLQVSELRHDGAPLPVEGYKIDARNGIIKNTLGKWRGLASVDYTAGLAANAQSVPANIQLALWQWVADILHMQDASGARSESLGDYSISYYDERALPQSVALLLEPYRKVAL